VIGWVVFDGVGFLVACLTGVFWVFGFVGVVFIGGFGLAVFLVFWLGGVDVVAAGVSLVADFTVGATASFRIFGAGDRLDFFCDVVQALIANSVETKKIIKG